MKIYEAKLEGIQGLLEYVEANSLKTRNNNSHEIAIGDWHGTRNWRDAVKLAVNGWEEGALLAEKFSSQFLDVVASLLKIDDYFYDVNGQDFDLDRVLIGEPECWLQTEQIEVKAPANHTLRVAVNIGASAMVPASVLVRKGAATIALVRLLEKTRRSVEIVAFSNAQREMFDFNKPVMGSEFCNVSVTLKNAGEDVDLSKLAFGLAHPSMLRRLMFAVRERTWVNLPSNYGFSTDYLKPECDIYVGASSAFNAAFETEEGAEQWILAELTKQGVELKGEGQ